jgi:NAD(P)-dependent dehydrogenase (short-subunit alcohol dehydrogenase family)
MGGTVLITGSSDGLGRALARHAHAHGWTVLAHGRDEEKLVAVADELPGTRTLRADLACLRTVEGLAREVLASTERLDALVCNAGVGARIPPHRAESVDGIELRFAVNYLAGYSLVRRLLGLLRKSAPARIVFIASTGQMPLDFSDVMLSDGSYSGIRAYCQSKLAQVMLAFDLGEELAGTGVTATAVHPGTLMPTRMVAEAGIAPVDSLESGVDAVWNLVADPALEGVSGRYFDRMGEAAPDAQAHDPGARAVLRELSRELTGV